MSENNFVIDKGLTINGGGNIDGVNNIEVAANISAGNLVTFGTAGDILMTGGSLSGVGNVSSETDLNLLATSGNIHLVALNTTIDSGLKQWKFEIDGNLTLPAGNPNINYANGAPYGASGAAGNAGEIQFNNGGVFAGSPNLTFDGTTLAVGTEISVTTITSATNIDLVGITQEPGSGREGGDINIIAGTGANSVGLGAFAGTGGDVNITGGDGGHGDGHPGAEGGVINIVSGAGGPNGTNGAGPGGSINILASTAGFNNGNFAAGALGGSITLEAGATTLENAAGGAISLTTGTGGPGGSGGALTINVPPSDAGSGGTWTFGGNGTLTFPDNSGAGWPINQQRFGMGNIGAWLDGQWTIGEFSGSGVSGQVGIRIDPGIEGNTGITLPSQADSVTQPVTIYNYGGGNVKIDSTYSTSWTFDTNGLLTLPSGNVTIGSVLGGDAILSNNVPFGVISQGNTGATVVQWSDDIANTSQLSAIYVNGPFGNVGDIQVRSGNVSSPNVWTFDTTGALNLTNNGVIRQDGPVNIVATDYAQLQWVDSGNINIPDPNGSGGPKNWAYVDNGGFHVETNLNNGGSSFAWDFDTNGNFTTTANIVGGNVVAISNFVGANVRTNLTDFNWSESITGIATGASTVVTLANNVFGDPWSGQVTITGVTGTTEANATWWYQAVDSNQFQLYTDSSLSTPVDSSAWGAYVSGGFAVTFLYGNIEINAQNITIRSDHGDYANKIWSFNSNGSTIFPTLTVNLHNGGNQSAQTLQFGDPSQQAVITGPTPPAGQNAQRLIIQGQNGGDGEGGDVYLWAGDANVNGGDIKIYAGDADNGASPGYGGYINIDGGSGFDSGGQLTLTGGYSQGGSGGQISITPGYSGGAAGSPLNLNGGQSGSADGGNVNITAGYGQANGGAVTIAGGGSALGLPGYGNVQVTAGVSTWSFDNTGTMTVPGEGIIQSLNDTVVLQSKDTGTGNIVTARLGTTGGLYFEGTEYPYGWLNLTNSSGDANILSPSGSVNIDAANGTSGAAGKNINITAGDADQTDYYTTAGGDVSIQGGMGAFNDGGGGGPGGNVNLVAGTSADPAGHAGNINLTAGTNSWTFDHAGGINLPGGTGVIESFANNIGIYSDAGQTNGVVLYDTGIEMYGIDDVSIYADNGNLTWTFDNSGTLLAPGNISAAGNITGSYIIGDGSQLTGLPASYGDSNVATFLAAYGSNTVSTTGNITAGNFIGSGSNVDIAAGAYDWTFDSTGNLTLPSNSFAVNYANGTPVSLGGGSSYGNANVATFLANFGANTISTTGNISAGNVDLNGNLTVNGSPIYGVPASYAKYTRTTTQTGITTNSVIVCNVSEAAFGSDISVNTSTGNVTLAPNNTYRVRGTAGALVNNGNPAGGAWRWYNATSGSYVGGFGTSLAPAASNYNTGAIDTAEVVITPGVTTVLQLQMIAVSNMGTIGSGTSVEAGYPWIDIEVIGGQAPITAFSTAGNVTGGNVVTGGIVSATGNITGGNLITTGSFTSATISSTGNITSGNGFHLILGNATSALRQNSSNANVQLSGSVTLNPDTAASALNGVLIGGSGYILGPGGSRNITLNYSTNGGMGAQSNVNAGVGGSGGSFIAPGTLTTGINGLLIGPTFTPLSNTSAGFVANVNNYTQITFQNKSTGADATADYILTADNGSDTVNYGDFGIINSGYDNLTPTNSLGNIVFAADTYIYAQGNVSNTAQSGGNLVIGTATANKTVKIFAGGNTASALVANISNTGVSVAGNVTASNFIGNISITGNVQGTSANVSLVAGSYTATFDNTGVLTLPTNGGDEGGEIRLGIPATNTTLTSRVTVDVYRDSFRIFDGSTKGVYVDLSQAATGVGTLLNNRVSGLVNAGTFVTMDNIKATVTSSGNRGLSLAAVSGTFAYSIGGNFATTGGSGGAATTGTMTTTATSSIFNWGFPNTAEISTYILTDTTNSRCYRITLQIGASYNNNSIIIERLI